MATTAAPSASSRLSEEDVRVFGCDTWPLHYACRVGNLEHVRFLVEARHYAVDQPDAHDASPLYLAALCGHAAICRYLLERGARCDPDSGGDAARVFYVALTPALRALLREWSLSAAARDPWRDGLRRALRDGRHADCAVAVGTAATTVRLHRIVLHARCPRLLERMEPPAHDGDPCHWSLPLDDASSHAMMKFLEFLYTGVFEATDLDTARSARELADAYGATSLRKQLAEAIDESSASSFGKAFRCEVDLVPELRRDLRRLAARVATPHDEAASLAALATLVELTDATLECHGRTWSVNRFRLAGSEYLDCALSGGFREARTSVLDLSHLVDDADLVPFLLQWLYCDEFTDEPSVEAAVALVELSAVLLCPRLAAHAAHAVLLPAADADNALGLLRLARAHDLDRLEDRCVAVIGARFAELADRPELLAVLREEAAAIRQGGDARVIDLPLAAEIRSAIKRSCAGDDRARTTHLTQLQALMDHVLAEMSDEVPAGGLWERRPAR